MNGTMPHDPGVRLVALEAENERLRTALAEMTVGQTGTGHELLLRDAMPAPADGLRCRHAAVPGTVTVVVPAYQAEGFIERAVRSVWSQTYPADRIELLVVDDGSRDRTRAIAERLATESPVAMRILGHPGHANRGVAPTRQRALVEATGEFVAFLDADDAFLPERLACGVEAIAAPALAAICSLGWNVDEYGEAVKGHNGTTRAGEWEGLGEGLSPPFTFDQLWQADPIANSSLLVRRSALEQVGGFPALMAHQAEDWLLVLKLSLLAPIPCLARELFLYTHHPGAYTHAYHASGWREGARLEVFYHLAWWMLRTPGVADLGARFFRREYPRLIADHQRLLPLVRDYYASGGRAASGATALDQYLAQQAAESATLKRVLHAKLQENKRLRQSLTEARRLLVHHPTMA